MQTAQQRQQQQQQYQVSPQQQVQKRNIGDVDEQVCQVIQDSDMGAGGRPTSGILTSRDSGAVDGGIPLSQSSIAEEYCQTHSDIYVAFDKKKNELVCNQCIYNEVEDVQKALEQLTFTSYVASSLKELFDEKFIAYKNSLQDMNKIAPKVISTTLESTVNKFFESVDAQITEVEQGVLSKIQGSTNLKELEQLLCREKDGFGLELEKLYEQNRLEIDGFVQKGCYSSVVSKKDHYEDLITKMRGNNEKMQKTVDEGQRKIERIMTIKQQHETEVTIGKRLHEIVDSCLEIDLSQANSAYKRQKVTQEQDQQQLQQQAQVEALQRQQMEQARLRKQQEEAIAKQAAAATAERQRQEQLQAAAQVAERERQRQAADKLRQEQIQATERLRQQQIEQQQQLMLQKQEEQRRKVVAEQEAAAENERRIQREQYEATVRAKREAEERAHLQEQERLRQQQQLQQQEQQRLENERQRQIEEQVRLQKLRQQQQEQEQLRVQQQEQERLAQLQVAQQEKALAEEQLKRQLEADAEREKQAEIQRQKNVELQQQQQQQEMLRQQQEHARQQEIVRQQLEMARLQQEQARLQEVTRQEELQRQKQSDDEKLRVELQRQEQVRQEQVRQEQILLQQKEREASEAAELQKRQQDELVKQQQQMQQSAELKNRLQMQQLLEEQNRGGENLNNQILQHQSLDAQMAPQTYLEQAQNLILPSIPQQKQEQPLQAPERVSEDIVIHDSTLSDQVHEGASSMMVQDYPQHAMQMEDQGQIVEIVESNNDRDDDHHQMIELDQQTAFKTSVTETSSVQMQQIQQVVDQHVPEIQQMVSIQQQIINPQVQEISMMPPTVPDLSMESAPLQQQVPMEVSSSASVQEIQNLAPEQHQQQSVPSPLEVGPNTYGSFMKQSANRVTKCVPDQNLDFHQEKDKGTMLDCFMYRVVSLPTGRAFVIGGAKDVHGSHALKTTHELVDGALEEKAQMWIARSAFGLAVYPNFSQIFIAGGKINENEATKHCERYIVAQNVWKRLPELREPKFNTSLCFFNNGGTLYCFGGLTQQGSSQLLPSGSIERLSKGQNSWQLLELRLPKCLFDMGALQITANEVIIFGGFEQGAQTAAYLYTTGPDDGKFTETRGLETADFFEQNGVFINLTLGTTNVSSATNDAPPQKFIFNGHTHNHLFDQATMEFKTLSMQ